MINNQQRSPVKRRERNHFNDYLIGEEFNSLMNIANDEKNDGQNEQDDQGNGDEEQEFESKSDD